MLLRVSRKEPQKVLPSRWNCTSAPSRSLVEIWELSEKLLETTTVADLIKGWDGTDRLEEAAVANLASTNPGEEAEAGDRGRRYLPRN